MITKFPSKFPFKFPIPGPLGGPLVDIIIGGAKILWDKFIKSRSTDEAAKKGSLDIDNINDVIDYNKLLNEFIKEFEEDIYALEEKVVVECTEYYEELILLVQAVEDSKEINLKSNNIKMAVERLKRYAKGSLAKSIHRKISLDNSELKRILSLSAGQLKKDRIQGFKEEVINQVLGDFINDVKASIEDLSYDISEQLDRIISDIRKNNEMLLNELTLLENAKDNEEDTKNLIELAETKIILCDEILSGMRL